MGKKHEEDKSKSIKMSRLAYEAERRRVAGGRQSSSPSSSDSETSRIRDTSAQNVGRVNFQAQNDGQSAQWAPSAAGPSTITYDPSRQYYPQTSQPGYTVRATVDHELAHENADRTYSHPSDPQLRGVNMHLPGNDPDSQALRQSYGAQTDTISNNWEHVRAAAAADPGIRNNPGWAEYVDARIEYVQATPHQHNESVANEMIGTLNTARLGGGPLANQLRAISNEAYNRPHGAEAAPVARVTSATSTRTSAYTNTEKHASGKQRRK